MMQRYPRTKQHIHDNMRERRTHKCLSRMQRDIERLLSRPNSPTQYAEYRAMLDDVQTQKIASTMRKTPWPEILVIAWEEYHHRTH